MDIIELLSYSFIQRAIIAGLLIAVTCSLLGTQLVLRRLSLIGDGLAHVTFSGVALGIVFGVYPLYTAIPVVILCSLGIVKLIEKARIYGDAAIGIVSSLGIATGVILATFAGGFNVDLFSFLFGNILTISTEDVITSIALFIVTLFIFYFFYQEIFSITFDEEFARTLGIKTKRLNALLVIMTSVTVVLAMKIVGIMLTSALLIMPAVCSFQIAKGFKNSLIIATFISTISVISGIFISLLFNLPTGACIIITNFLFLLIILVYKSRV